MIKAKLESVMQQFFNGESYYLCNEQNEDMESVITRFMIDNGIEQFEICQDVVFDCPSASFGYTAVSWIENGKLQMKAWSFE